MSLRASLIGLVALANLAVFGAGLFWTRQAEERVDAQRTLARTDLLGTLVGTLVDARGDLRSAALLRWDRWDPSFGASVAREDFRDCESALPAQCERADAAALLSDV